MAVAVCLAACRRPLVRPKTQPSPRTDNTADRFARILRRIQTLDSQLANQFGQETLIARLTSLFGLTALLLASIGLYGVTSYSVARRAKEIGIRVALGADRRALVGMVLRNAYMLVGIGLALGIPIAAAMARLMGSRLYGIDWYNPVIFAEAAAVLAVFALIATLAPARRAAATDPVESLRGD